MGARGGTCRFRSRVPRHNGWARRRRRFTRIDGREGRVGVPTRRTAAYNGTVDECRTRLGDKCVRLSYKRLSFSLKWLVKQNKFYFITLYTFYASVALMS